MNPHIGSKFSDHLLESLKDDLTFYHYMAETIYEAQSDGELTPTEAIWQIEAAMEKFAQARNLNVHEKG